MRGHHSLLVSLLVLACSTALSVAAVPESGPTVPAATPTPPAATPTPLVLISFDGFRWDYPEHADTPALDRLAATGVRAERLVPVFPSKTFPGHYSIVTGLHPGHHGIVSNNMRDPRWPEPFGLGDRSEVEKGRWWGGEPIWVTLEKAAHPTAVFFWPGSEAPVQGIRPTRWRRFDAGVPFEARVDRALEWLQLPAGERPALVALYFEEPNGTGHRRGPLAPETLAVVERVDAVLGRLLDGLEARGIEAHVVVTSDHGMARNDAARVIRLDELVDLREEELFEAGALVQIFPRPGREDMIYAALAGAHPHLRVYRRDEIPEALHLYDHPRLPLILATPDPGWEVAAGPLDEGPIPGNHGQDPRDPDMHGIFYAAGPDLRGGVVLPWIEQVDLYNLMAALTGVEPAPNDGDPARIRGLLRSGRPESDRDAATSAPARKRAGASRPGPSAREERGRRTRRPS